MHRLSLGVDPAKGKTVATSYNRIEMETGTRLEQFLGKRIERDSHGGADWLRGKIGYDASSPPPTKFFNDKTFKQWTNSVQSHFNKQGVDFVVVDPVVRNLNIQQTIRVENYINNLPKSQFDRIILLNK